MAVLNIRVDDQVHLQLKERADAEGVTVSDVVRRLVMEEVAPVTGDVTVKHGDASPPESMRLLDRQVLSLLHKILGRVLPADGTGVDGDLEHQQQLAEILEEGFTGEYWSETAGFRSELSNRDCTRVNDILEMFRVIKYSVERLAEQGNPVDSHLVEQLRFLGFDHNNGLEGHMASYVEFLMNDGRWTDLKEQFESNDGGNSHMQMLDAYLRMVNEYRQIVTARDRGYINDYLLSGADLQRIADARTHPSSR